MEVYEAIRKRRSVRNFKDKQISDEVIGRLLDAFRWAPSAGNRQPWEVIVVDKEEKKSEIAKGAYSQNFIQKASHIFVICVNEKIGKSKYGERGIQLYALESVGAAIENLMLTATSLGLGSCWVGAFKEEEVKKIMDCPEEVRPVAIVPLGYPSKEPSPPFRYEINEFSHLNNHGGKALPRWKDSLKKSLKEIKERLSRV